METASKILSVLILISFSCVVAGMNILHRLYSALILYLESLGL
jgi:hypothetical protein